MNKSLKKGMIIAACVVGVCGAVWGGLTIARNAQRGSVNVYAVSDFAMTSYWGDTSSTSGTVTTDKIQKVLISSSQTVNKVWVAEGDTVRKGDKLISYDSTLTQASVEQARIDYDRQDESLTTAKNELEYLKKAKNKETLKQELEKLTTELDALKKQYDQNPDHPYDGDAAVTEGRLNYTKTMTVKDGDGAEQKVNVQYYSWLSSSRLCDSKVTEILEKLGTRADKDHPSVDTYVVLVQRYEDKVGGYADSSLGLVITETYTAGDDTAEPAVPESRSVSFLVRSDLPEFEDTQRTYDDAAIQKLQRKIALVNAYLDSSMEQKELAQAIVDKAKEVKEKEVNQKLAKLTLDKKIKELGDGNVYAEFDGTVKAVRDPDEAYNNSEAVIELSGGGGYYITGTLSEMDLGSVKVGDTVQVSSWMTGVSCEGTIVSIDDYPSTGSSGYSYSDGNSNVSYYPFKVFVTEDADLQAGDYVELQYQKTSAEDEGTSLYIDSMFVREDSGKSYVMVRGEDGKLEKRWVQTGRNLWGSYTQIRGGLTAEDYVAFPYGRDVTEGASTVEATSDQLYAS